MIRLTPWMLAALLSAGGALALPQGGQVVAGQASIGGDATDMVINQTSGRAIMNWDSFNIGSSESVFFQLPDAGSISLNRVLGGQASSIFGRLGSNGGLYLINPQGIMFGAGSQVNVGSLMATTANVGDNTFMAGGAMDFSGGQGSVFNGGTLTIGPQGYAILAAPDVTNAGAIVAPQGNVQLAGAAAFTVDPVGDNLLTLAPNPMAFAAQVANPGSIAAQGGQVALTTQATDAALASVINTSGMIEANTFENQNGRIVLGNAITQQVQVAGTVAANGITAGETGGVVDVVGQFVDVQTGARIAADGPAGGGAIHVGGNYQGQGPLSNAQTSRVASGALLTANATDTGNGGEVIVWADGQTRFAGTSQARGGVNGGDGGFLEISGKHGLSFSGAADTLAPQGKLGTLLFDPTNIAITDGGPDADDGQVADGTVLGADGGAIDFSISEQSLEALAAGTNISLQATGNITINDLTDDTLTLATTGSVDFTADSDSNGTGSFAMAAGDSIVTDGANLTITGANLSLGGLNTATGSGGNIALTADGGAGTITLNNNLTTNGGNITLTGNTTLAQDAGLSTGTGGDITLTGTVTGASRLLGLTANTGNITLGSNVTLDNLILSSGNNLTLGGSWAVANPLDFTNVGALTLTAATVLNANSGASNITFDSGNSINGAYSLTVTGNAITLPTMGGSTPLTVLTTNAGSTLTLDNAITTTNDQILNATAINLGTTLTSTAGEVRVNAPVTLTAASTLNGNTLDVNSTINGAQTLNVTSVGAADLSGGVLGGTTPLTALTANTGGLTVVGVRTSGNQTYTGTTNLTGTYTSTAGTLAFNSAANLTGTTNLNTTNNDITFASTLNGSNPLTVGTGTGLLRLQGVTGGVTPLAGLTNTGASLVTGNVTTNGNQSYGDLTLAAALTATGGSIATGNLVLTGASSMNTSTGNNNITLGGTGNGAFALTLNAGTGDLTLADDFSIASLILTAADDLTLGGNLTTTGALDFTNIDDILLSGASVWNAGSSAITMDAANAVTGGFDLTLIGSTLTPGTLTSVNNLVMTASTLNDLSVADISTNGTQTYNGPTNLGVNLTTTGDDVTLNGATTLTASKAIATSGGDLNVNSTLNGAQALTVTTGAGDITLAGAVGGSTPLTDMTFTTTGAFNANQLLALSGDLSVNATTIALAQALNADNIVLTGAATIANPITAATNLTMTGDNIINATLNAGNNLAMVGNNTLNAVLTAGNDLTLTGNNLLNANLNAGADMTVTGNTTLTNNVTLTSGGGSGDTLTHNGDIAGDYALTLAAGSGNIAMSGALDLDTMTITSGNDFIFGGGSIEVDNGLDFSPVSRILLGGDTNIYGRDGTTRSNVTLGTFNNVLATASDVDLLVYGALVTMYQVGDTGSGKLGSLTIDATIAQILGNIYTTGAQTITAEEGLAGFLSSGGGDISLNTAANLVGDIFITTSGGDIYINQPLNGPYQMDLNAGLGTVNINAALGDTTPLTNMTIVGSLINLDAPITTTGSQQYTGETNLRSILTIGFGDITYNSAVNLGGDGAIDTSGGNGTITFNSTVDGPQNLTLRAGSGGNIFFNDEVGAQTRVGSITVESTNNITFTKGAHLTNYYQNQIDGLASFGYAPGLDVTEGIHVATSHDLEGRFTGRDISLEALGLIHGDVFASNSLHLKSAQTLLSGSIRGLVGREAAQLITFDHFNSGPHYFAGLNLPLGDGFYAYAGPMAGSPHGSAVDLPAGSGEALNPFTALPVLAMADEGVVEGDGDALLEPWLP